MPVIGLGIAVALASARAEQSTGRSTPDVGIPDPAHAFPGYCVSFMTRAMFVLVGCYLCVAFYGSLGYAAAPRAARQYLDKQS